MKPPDEKGAEPGDRRALGRTLCSIIHRALESSQHALEPSAFLSIGGRQRE